MARRRNVGGQVGEDLAARYVLARVYARLRPRLIWLAFDEATGYSRMDDEAIMLAARAGGLAAAIEEIKAQLLRLGADPADIDATIDAARRSAQAGAQRMDPARIEAHTAATERSASAERNPR